MRQESTPHEEEAGSDVAEPSGATTAVTTATPPPLREVTLNCGWGRLVFGNTFDDASRAADVLRAEAQGARDICVYLDDPHVLVARRHDELFIDPSFTYRLALPAATLRGAPPGIVVRPLADEADAEAVNAIYAANNMLTAPADVLVENAATPQFIHLVAEHGPTGQVVGTITGVDHVETFGCPEGGSSLWCLTVDMNAAPPGSGQALLAGLAERLTALGRRYVDLSVLADNSGAIRLYERLGFRRTPMMCVKRKNPINEPLFIAPHVMGFDALNPYARIIADEARRRGVRVEILDAEWGELRLTHGGRRVVTRESLSELTTAVAMSRCDDKRVTRRILERHGLRVARGIEASGGPRDERFLREVGTVVVKPARGEQGVGITVGVEGAERLRQAVQLARRHCPDVLIEEFHPGIDLRVVVIGYEVVAAAIRRPAAVTGDGVSDIRTLIEKQSARRAAATGGESRIPLDATTEEVVHSAGWRLDQVLPEGVTLEVRRTANLHTGGTIHDVTDDLHPEVADACVSAARALGIPVTGLDLLVPDPAGPEYVFVEANERPGLANHEPRPTAERFLDLLFPNTEGLGRAWDRTS
ncbi:MAG TPA: N-acetylglutaminylglutamine synthetase [Miltoncostaeaceae bacterium]|nr:N-acetylglutaminylglutamine synthetase [Miltoncostaeaceae bacterium]